LSHKKNLNPVGQWIYDSQNQKKGGIPMVPQKKKVRLYGRIDLTGLKHENLSFELQLVANVEDGF
jgi:hypothetical protein